MYDPGDLETEARVTQTGTVARREQAGGRNKAVAHDLWVLWGVLGGWQ